MPRPPAGTLPEDPVSEHPALVRLRTDGALGERVRRGVAWTALFRVVVQVLSTASMVVLARLLAPADYGLVALTTIFTGFAALFSELGLAAAVVQSRRVTERLLSSAFWLNVLTGVALTALLVACAPLVAAFYGDPRVTPLLQVSALLFTLNSGVVHSALLQRSLRFKTLGALEVWAALAGLGVTITLAALGFGAYSLVLGPLVQTVVQTVLLWGSTRWLPRSFLHRRELAELWRFGSGLTGANALNFVARNADTAILGRAVSAGDLGLYGRSYALMMVPLAQVTSVITRVLMPALASMQDDAARLRRAWLTSVRASLVLGLPVGWGVAASAPSLVETLYGPRWLGMATVLTLLAASVPPQLVGRNLGPVYQALGRTGLQFRTTLVTTALTVAAVLVGVPWGIEGVAVALLVKSWVVLPIPLRPAMRLMDLRVRDLWGAVDGLLLSAAVMVLLAVAARWALAGQPSWVVLLAQVVAGGAGYVATLWWVDREPLVAALSKLRRRRS